MSEFTERRMTIGRPTVEATEDDNNLYVNGFVIPKGDSQDDKNKREEETRNMYAIWCAEKGSNKQHNISLNDSIVVVNASVEKIVSVTLRPHIP